MRGQIKNTRLALSLLLVLLSASAPPQSDRVGIGVDAARSIGTMAPIWAFFGYDEPNYTYMTDGKKLLSELAALSPHPVYVRTHNLLTSGDGTPALKWGSTNAYTEDADGKPRYDWTIVDRIFDTLRERGMKPLVEIGFMPEALSTRPQPYRPPASAARTRRGRPRTRPAATCGGSWSTACAARTRPPVRPGRRSITSAFTPRERRGSWTGTSARGRGRSCATSTAASRSSP